jgi:hypothetical protein
MGIIPAPCNPFISHFHLAFAAARRIPVSIDTQGWAMDGETIWTRGPLWLWNEGKGTWHFLTIGGDAVGEIKYAALMRDGGVRRGFGAVAVRATIGGTSWRTSVFPHAQSGGYILPVKASVRKAEGLNAGDEVEVGLEL